MEKDKNKQIEKIEVNDLRRQLTYKTTKLYSHGIWYVRDHLKKYYDSNDQKRLSTLMKLCRVALYKIKIGKDIKVWDEIFRYLFEQWKIDKANSLYMKACKKAEAKKK